MLRPLCHYGTISPGAPGWTSAALRALPIAVRAGAVDDSGRLRPGSISCASGDITAWRALGRCASTRPARGGHHAARVASGSQERPQALISGSRSPESRSRMVSDSLRGVRNASCIAAARAARCGTLRPHFIAMQPPLRRGRAAACQSVGDYLARGGVRRCRQPPLRRAVPIKRISESTNRAAGARAPIPACCRSPRLNPRRPTCSTIRRARGRASARFNHRGGSGLVGRCHPNVERQGLARRQRHRPAPLRAGRPPPAAGVQLHLALR